MNPNMKSNFTKAHNKAWSSVKKDKSLPDLKVNVLIDFICEMFSCDKDKRMGVVKKYAGKYGPSFKKYGIVLAEELGISIINEKLKKSDREEFRSMARDGVTRCLVESSEKVIKTVAAYMNKEITEEEFIRQMSRTGVREVGEKITKAFGIDPSRIISDPSMALKLAGPILAYQGAMGAYREYRKAMDDLRIAHESRVQVEEECRKSIEMIRKYREEAELRVSKYMNEHLDAFAEGFEAMNQAIISNDPDGYISGNVQIQQLLGAEIQFTNQDEFDSLMDSDEDFIF